MEIAGSKSINNVFFKGSPYISEDRGKEIVGYNFLMIFLHDIKKCRGWGYIQYGLYL
jgi:hypothetical protein